MKGEIISVGTELLLGHITDTNASWLAQKLGELGINCYYISQVGDNLGRLIEIIQKAWSRSNLVIITGGLGPTEDDLTREAISNVLHEELIIQPEVVKNLKVFFASRNLEFAEGNLKQAQIISSAELLKNPFGTAPAWWVSKDGKIIISMPGVQDEMKNIWNSEVVPRLRQKQGDSILITRTFKVLGMGESHVENLLKPLLSNNNPTIATYVKRDGVHVRTSAMASSNQKAISLLDGMENAVRKVLGRNIYGVDETSIAEVVSDLLKKTKRSVAIAEEFTGGIVSSTLSEHAKEYFLGGLVFSKPNIKVNMDVKEGPGLMRSREIAFAALQYFHSHLGLAIAADDVRGGSDMADGKRTYYTLIDADGNVLAALTRIDTTATSVVKNRVMLNALNFLRGYLLENS